MSESSRPPRLGNERGSAHQAYSLCGGRLRNEETADCS
jgi:hypothetical protein